MIQIIITALISFNIGFFSALFWWSCHQQQDVNFIYKKGVDIMEEKLSLGVIGLQYIVENLYSNTEFTVEDILELVPNEPTSYIQLCINRLIDKDIIKKTETGYKYCEVKEV